MYVTVGETDYVSYYAMWSCPQLHLAIQNPCRCQLYQTLGGIYLTVTIQDSMKRRQEFRTFPFSFLEIFITATITPSTFLHAFAPACIQAPPHTLARSQIYFHPYTQNALLSFQGLMFNSSLCFPTHITFVLSRVIYRPCFWHSSFHSSTVPCNYSRRSANITRSSSYMIFLRACAVLICLLISSTRCKYFERATYGLLSWGPGRFLAAAFSDGSYLAHVNGAYLRHVTFCILCSSCRLSVNVARGPLPLPRNTCVPYFSRNVMSRLPWTPASPILAAVMWWAALFDKERPLSCAVNLKINSPNSP